MTTTKTNQEQQSQEPSQAEIIQTLRQMLEQSRQQNNELKDELKMIKTAVLTGDIQAAIYAVHAKAEKMNMERQAQADEYNRRKAQELALTQAAKREAEEKAVLESNPGLLQYCKDKKSKAAAIRDKAIELATRFYNMTTEQARSYVDIRHTPRESAVKFILQTTEEKDQTIYECLYCGDRSFQLDEFERHCYLRQEDHKEATISRIQNTARQDIAAATEELQRDIDVAIKAKQAADLRARMAKEREAREKLKSELPYAK